MNLRFDLSPAAGYRRASQIARRITEPWAEQNLFCLACSSDRLVSSPTNTPVLDLRCERCHAEYQLKSKATPYGRKATNSAYALKMTAIESGRAPHYAFLHYDRSSWSVRGLFVIPGHFFTPAIIERRNPLKPTARRAGWVGSNILLHELPPEARVAVVEGAVARAPSEVRRDWKRFAFLQRGARGGWSADVLLCVRRLERETGSADFTLSDFCQRFEVELAARHPANLHVKDKIRQQLQVLRDGGVLRFIDNRGRYRVVR